MKPSCRFPFPEDAARVLMQRLRRAGDGAAAVRVFEDLRATLRRELRMAPSAETLRVAGELRSAMPPAAGPPRERPLPDALARPEYAPLVGRQMIRVAR